MYTNKKFTFLIISILAAVLLSCSEYQNDTSTINEDHNKTHPHSDDVKAKKNKVIYYTCPMPEHKHVASLEPEECTECQMGLVAAVETNADSSDYYGCPMKSHSHVRRDKPGVCPDCGMDLKPMQLIEIKINY